MATPQINLRPSALTRQAPPRVAARPATAGQPWLFAAWMGGAALLAVVAGFVLGILAATEAGIGGERWSPVVQAHGRIQLFGFAATFIVALAFEFLPRLNAAPMLPRQTRLGVPALLGAGSVLLALGQIWHDSVSFLVLPGGLLFAAGAAAYIAVVMRVPAPFPLARNPQPLFVRASAIWLGVAAVLSLWSFGDATGGVLPLDASRAVVEVFLRGFVMLIIVGIAVRAFVGHLGLPPLSARRQFELLAALNGFLILWIAGQGLGALPGSVILTRVADAGYALTLLALTVILRAVSKWRWRAPRGERYELLIPLAWLGAIAYAVMLLVNAIFAPDGGLSLYESGAVRHIFLLGFMIPLMVAMAHITLARFGVGYIPWEPALTAGFYFVLLAWPMRVLPVLFSETPSDAGRAVLGLAGVLSMAGLALVAVVCVRTALQVGRR